MDGSDERLEAGTNDARILFSQPQDNEAQPYFYYAAFVLRVAEFLICLQRVLVGNGELITN